MPNKNDLEDRKQSTRLFLGIAATIVVLVALIVVFVAPGVSAAVSPGLGLRDAAIAAFVVTLLVMLVLMFAAGDGLLGEIQYVLPAFFAFFLLVWALIAWAF